MGEYKLVKIGYITATNPEIDGGWSGTTQMIYRSLNKIYDVVPVVVGQNSFLEKFLIFLNKLSMHMLHKNIYQDNTSLTMAKIRAKKLKKVLYKMKNSEFDLLFVPAGSTYIAFGENGLPIVYLSDATFHLMVDYYYNGLSKRQINNGNSIEMNALKRSDRIIYSSDWAQKDAISFYKISNRKCAMIPFGANMNNLSKLNNRSIDSKKEINLLFVGVDSERKGLKVAVDTLRKLNHSADIRFTLTVIGSDEEWINKEENVKNLGFLNKSVSKDANAIDEAYKNADFFILPTLAEAAGIVFAEASMYGLPILTYATGGVETYVRNGLNGFAVSKNIKDFSVKINEIIKSPELYRQLSCNARKLYDDELNWGKWLDGVDLIIKELL